MSNVINMLNSEIEVARAARAAQIEGSEEWKRCDSYVQILKTVQFALQNNTDLSKALPGGIKATRTERAKHQKDGERYKKVDALVQALKDIGKNPTVPAPQPEGKPKVVVVLPPCPNLPSVVAFYRQQLELGEGVRVEPAFCHLTSPGQVQTKFWQQACSKGHKPRMLLGNEAIAKLSSSVLGAEGFNKVIDSANSLESCGLWGSRFFLPRLLNDLYFLREGDDDEQKIFYRVLDVVKAFLLPQDKRTWNSMAKYKKDMIPLWQGFNIAEKEVAAFSLPQYFRHLFCAGVDRKEIQEKIGWWIRRFKGCDDKFRKAADKRFEVRPFMVWGRSAGFVSLGDYWDSRSFHYQWVSSGVLQIGVLRNNKGHVVVLPSSRQRPQELNRLFQRLSADEPEQWYLHAPSKGPHVLLNGGFRYDAVRPTKKGSTDIIRLIQKYVSYPRR